MKQTDTILITGGRGFLGKQLTNYLKANGYTNVIQIGRKEVDLTLQQETSTFIKNVNPDIVFHLAANVGGIGANLNSPAKFFYDNLMMGMNVIETCRLVNVKKFIQVGTVCSYPKYTPTPFNEKELYNGYPEETNAPYGIAKRSLHTMLSAYRTQYNFNGIYAIPVNMYGPGDNFNLVSGHVIPVIIQKIQNALDNKSDKIYCYGTGTVTREFIHVSDVARGLCLAAEKYNNSNPINLGTGKDIQIKDLILLISKLMGWKGTIVFDSSMPDGQPKRKLDVTKAMKSLNFKSDISLKLGLKTTIDWYRQNHD